MGQEQWPQRKGTMLGHASEVTLTSDGLTMPTDGIAIAGGEGTARVSVNNACQIGQGHNTSPGSIRYRGGQLVQMHEATYDFDVDGGALGAIEIGDDLPDNAVILDGFVDIISAIVSTGGTGTIALHIESADDILVAVDGDTLSGIEAVVPVGTAATAVKVDGAKKLQATIATAVFTAGKFRVFLAYVVSE